MAIVLKPKKSETASAVPTTSDLAVGEICVNVADRKIYTRKSNNSIVVVSSHIDATVGGDLTGTVSDASIALGSDAAGDIIYHNGTKYIRLAKGTNGEVLTLASGVPSWEADSTNVSGTSVGGDLTGTVSDAQIDTNTVGISELNVSDGTAGQVLKTNGSGTLSFITITPGVSELAATAKAVTMAIALG
jgi:hypothetical protein